jgi:hypothetical protein
MSSPEKPVASRWQCSVTTLGAGRRLYQVICDGEALGNEAALQALAADASFRSRLLGWLAAEPFAAFFWELPPLSIEQRRLPFEFVVSDAPTLARAVADPAPFRRPLGSASQDGIAEFENLGGDAWLVVPEPRAEGRYYTHLAAFLRGAPEPQRDALLARLGSAVRNRLSERPLWISTSGLGVYWLHVRLDSWPKYYQYGPYKRWPRV